MKNFALVLSTLTSIGLLATSANAAIFTVYVPGYFDSTTITGNFSSPNIGASNAEPPNITTTVPTGASATLTGTASGATETLTPSSVAAELGNISASDIVSVVFSGIYSYQSSATPGSLSLNVLASGSVVPLATLATGIATSTISGSINSDITSAVLANFNTPLALELAQTGTGTFSSVTGLKLAVTYDPAVPEPTVILGSLVGVVGLTALKNKTKKKV